LISALGKVHNTRLFGTATTLTLNTEPYATLCPAPTSHLTLLTFPPYPHPADTGGNNDYMVHISRSAEVIYCYLVSTFCHNANIKSKTIILFILVTHDK